MGDALNPARFYAYNPGSGAFLVSADRGATFRGDGLAGSGWLQAAFSRCRSSPAISGWR